MSRKDAFASPTSKSGPRKTHFINPIVFDGAEDIKGIDLNFLSSKFPKPNRSLR